MLVRDENDNKPVCESEDSIFEVQENEPVGKMCVSIPATETFIKFKNISTKLKERPFL